MPGHAYATAIPPRSLDRRGNGGAGAALGVAALCLVGLALVWAVAEHLYAFQLRDATALYDFTQLSRPRIDGAANFLVRLLDPTLFVLWGVALIAVAIARDRAPVALAVVAIMALAPFTSETLKPLLAHPHVQVGWVHIGAASWPSGHATAALALVYSAILVAPARLRPIVAVAGACFALAVGVSLLILAWHMPSDVVGGYLVATFWAALAVAALRATPARRRAPRDPTAARR